MKLSSGLLAFFCVIFMSECYAKSGKLIYFNSIGHVPAYYQLTDKDIKENGLQCVGRNKSTYLAWVLPNGVRLTNSSISTTTSTAIVYQQSTPRGLALVLSTKTQLTPLGVYKCEIHDQIIDGTVDVQYVWIVHSQDQLKPQVKSFSCSLEGLLVFNDLFVILLSSYIHNGAPTYVDCHLRNDPDIKLMKVSDDRLLEATITNAISRAIVGYLVPISKTPDDIICTVTNTAGNDSFCCSLKESGLSQPVITSITYHSLSQVLIKWTPVRDPNMLLADYVVYILKYHENDVIKIRTSGTQVVVTIDKNEIRKDDIYVVANSQITRDTKEIFLPSIGSQNIKCKPSTGLLIKITIKLTKPRKLSSEFNSRNEAIFRDLIKDIIRLVDIPENCAILDPKIENIAITGKWKLSKTKTKTKLKTKEKTSTKEKTPTKKTKKHKNKGKKSKTKIRTKRTKGSKVVADVLLFCNPCEHVVSDDKIIRPYIPKKSQKYEVTIREMSFSVTTKQKGNVEFYCNYNMTSNSITTCDCPRECFTSD